MGVVMAESHAIAHVVMHRLVVKPGGGYLNRIRLCNVSKLGLWLFLRKIQCTMGSRFLDMHHTRIGSLRRLIWAASLRCNFVVGFSM